MAYKLERYVSQLKRDEVHRDIFHLIYLFMQFLQLDPIQTVKVVYFHSCAMILMNIHTQLRQSSI